MTRRPDASRWPTLVSDRAAPALAELAALPALAAPALPGAACRDVDPDLHHPDGAESSPGYRRQAKDARAVCRRCPVLTECLTWALAHPQQTEHGVWGATTPAERRAVRRLPVPLVPAAPNDVPATPRRAS